jgi:hypothetical protein
LLKRLIIRGAVSHPDAGRYALGLRVPSFDSIGHLCLGGWEEPDALGSKIIVVNVDNWDGFVRKEAVGSFVKHAGGILAEDGLCLYVQVTHHCIAMPSTHHTDVAEINLAIQEGHSPASAQGSRTDFQRFDAGAMDVETHRAAQDFRDIPRYNEGASVATVERRNWCRQGGLVMSMEEDAAHSSFDGAAPGVATQSVNQFLVAVTIFLGGESVRNGGGGLDFGVIRCKEI